MQTLIEDNDTNNGSGWENTYQNTVTFSCTVTGTQSVQKFEINYSSQIDQTENLKLVYWNQFYSTSKGIVCMNYVSI